MQTCFFEITVMPNKKEIILEEIIKVPLNELTLRECEIIGRLLDHVATNEAIKVVLHKAWYEAYAEVAGEILLLND